MDVEYIMFIIDDTMWQCVSNITVDIVTSLLTNVEPIQSCLFLAEQCKEQ